MYKTFHSATHKEIIVVKPGREMKPIKHLSNFPALKHRALGYNNTLINTSTLAIMCYPNCDFYKFPQLIAESDSTESSCVL
jgi:hypothetical protein